jgi:predicted small lipoprotein YifL
MYRLLALFSLLLLTACGQQGPLYQPDEGLPVQPQASPAAAPAAPASPDRSDEARKRIPQTPSPAEAR